MADHETKDEATGPEEDLRPQTPITVPCSPTPEVVEGTEKTEQAGNHLSPRNVETNGFKSKPHNKGDWTMMEVNVSNSQEETQDNNGVNNDPQTDSTLTILQQESQLKDREITELRMQLNEMDKKIEGYECQIKEQQNHTLKTVAAQRGYEKNLLEVINKILASTEERLRTIQSIETIDKQSQTDDEEYKEMKSQLKLKIQDIKSLKNELQKKEEEITSWKNEVDNKDKEIDKNKNFRQQIRDKDTKIKELKTSLDSWFDQVRDKETQKKELENQLNLKIKDIKSLENELQTKKQEITSLENVVNNKDKEIDKNKNFRQQIRDKDAEMQTLTNSQNSYFEQIKSNIDRIKELENQLKSKDKENIQVKEENNRYLNEVKRLRNQLKDLENEFVQVNLDNKRLIEEKQNHVCNQRPQNNNYVRNLRGQLAGMRRLNADLGDRHTEQNLLLEIKEKEIQSLRSVQTCNCRNMEATTHEIRSPTTTSNISSEEVVHTSGANYCPQMETPSLTSPQPYQENANFRCPQVETPSLTSPQPYQENANFQRPQVETPSLIRPQPYQENANFQRPQVETPSLISPQPYQENANFRCPQVETPSLTSPQPYQENANFRCPQVETPSLTSPQPYQENANIQYPHVFENEGPQNWVRPVIVTNMYPHPVIPNMPVQHFPQFPTPQTQLAPIERNDAEGNDYWRMGVGPLRWVNSLQNQVDNMTETIPTFIGQVNTNKAEIKNLSKQAKTTEEEMQKIKTTLQKMDRHSRSGRTTDFDGNDL